MNYLGPQVPLHINRYYPANYWKKPPTSIPKLLSIRKLATQLGIEYIYIGNVGYSEYETTYCPKCGKVLIKRVRHRVTYYKVDNGKCPYCGYRIPIRGKYIESKKYWFF